ncbi:unnamed protein product [Somion occarium]|uniref:Uncharacterized protein n=1 Tax=Somion occarium TaxID=3059160 RepID=A0ABP1CYK6_9APHY
MSTGIQFTYSCPRFALRQTTSIDILVRVSTLRRFPADRTCRHRSVGIVVPLVLYYVQRFNSTFLAGRRQFFLTSNSKAPTQIFKLRTTQKRKPAGRPDREDSHTWLTPNHTRTRT